MTRAMLCLGAAALAAFAAPAFAQGPFDGTWKGDPSTAKFPTKPDAMMLKGGVFTCPSCTPPLTLRADGQFHKVAGHSYYDEAMVKPVDAHTISLAFRRGGKDTSGALQTVSADGRTLTTRWHNNDNANGKMTSGVVTATRVGAAPAGAHATSGSWRTSHVAEASPATMLISFRTIGDTLETRLGTGEHYTARFGGPAVPMVGDPGKTTVTVRRTGPRAFRETDMRGGKVVNTYDYSVAPSGRTVTMVAVDARDNSTTRIDFAKQ